MKIKELRKNLDQFKGQKKQVQKNLKEAKSRHKSYSKELKKHEHAREIIKEVGLKTQQALAIHISDITSLALASVFNDSYELKVDFIKRRNKTECDLLFSRNDIEINPLEAAGGGAVDVAAFALRVASWSMQHPRTRPIIILDEPMRFLSTDLQPKASEMLKQISEKLGIQFIIITHEEELTEQADHIIEVRKSKNVTKIIN